MNPKVTAYFTSDGAHMLHALEEETNRFFHFTGSEGLPLDHFAVVEEGARAEIEEQSVPFREGEEVHVDIVEPHMYSEDDAVAKVDGYLIEVTDAIPYVGEKMLVRIEHAGRTIARAVLAEVAEEAAAATDGAARGARARRQARRVGSAVAGAQAAQAGDARGPGRRGADRVGRRPRRDGPGGGRRLRRGRGEAARAAQVPHDEAAGDEPAPTTSPSPAPDEGGGRRLRGLGRRGRRGTIEASAPRPQRRTAPFACERRSLLRSQRVT